MFVGNFELEGILTMKWSDFLQVVDFSVKIGRKKKFSKGMFGIKVPKKLANC